MKIRHWFYAPKSSFKDGIKTESMRSKTFRVSAFVSSLGSEGLRRKRTPRDVFKGGQEGEEGSCGKFFQGAVHFGEHFDMIQWLSDL